MKHFLSIFLMIILGMEMSFAQSGVTLTFSCQTTDGDYLQPDSITIENLTQNWMEVIYYPDTVYTLNVGTGVPAYVVESKMEIMPNPFDGTTRVNIQSTKVETVQMKISDMAGRICAEFSGKLEEGGNLFVISLTSPQTYVLSVQTASGVRSLKMENIGHAGSNHIAYTGATGTTNPVVKLKSTSVHPFQLGDEMRFTVYAYISDTIVAHETITQVLNTHENVTAMIPVSGTMLNVFSCTVKSKRTNETGYGNRITYVQDYDGNSYNVVQIGNQCWMKQNLRCTHYSDGNSIPLGDTIMMGNTNPYYYVPNENSDDISITGYLYNWYAMMHGAGSSSTNPSGVQGACPDGWHVPSDAEWTQLTSTVGDQSDNICSGNNTYIAKALATKTGWLSSNSMCAVGNDQSTNNNTGFSAFPVGQYYGSFGGYGGSALIWSSTEDTYSGGGWYRNINYTSAEVSRNAEGKVLGKSVRCVRDLQGNGGISQGTLPSLHGTTISNITPTTVFAQSLVTSEGSTDVTARGFCWSSSHYPTIGDFCSTEEIMGGMGFGHFSATLSNLSPNTTYYVRSWATNSYGTSYGNVQTFRTPSADGNACIGAATVTDYDGHVYNTVQIGNQCWMKENLRTTHYANGTAISCGGNLGCNTEAPNYSVSYPFYYYNVDVNTSICGLLYNWPAVMNGSSSSNSNPSGVQGICPNGWHVPSSSEWNQLTSYVSSQPQYNCNGHIAKSLCAASSGWNQWYCDYDPSMQYEVCSPGYSVSNNNATGFSALPSGTTDGVYENFLVYYSEVPVIRFWSSASFYSGTANGRQIYGIMSMIVDEIQHWGENGISNENACSVRCVKD